MRLTTSTVAPTRPTTVDNNCQSVTLPTDTVGSTFDTTNANEDIYVYNNSSVPVYEWNFAMTLGYNNVTLANEVGMCAYSDGDYMYNGLIADAQGATLVNPGEEEIAPYGTDTYQIAYYAGEPSALCGTTNEGPGAPVTVAGSLTNGAEGGTITPTFTLSISDNNTYTG